MTHIRVAQLIRSLILLVQVAKGLGDEDQYEYDTEKPSDESKTPPPPPPAYQTLESSGRPQPKLFLEQLLQQAANGSGYCSLTNTFAVLSCFVCLVSHLII